MESWNAVTVVQWMGATSALITYIALANVGAHILILGANLYRIAHPALPSVSALVWLSIRNVALAVQAVTWFFLVKGGELTSMEARLFAIMATLVLVASWRSSRHLYASQLPSGHCWPWRWVRVLLRRTPRKSPPQESISPPSSSPSAP